MYTEKYIQKAISGGFDKMWEGTYGCQAEVFLDPEFWKCLGKAMGWKHKTTNDKITQHKDCTRFCDWRREWHRFIDHLANGGSIEDFFKSLEK
jgi:hypothetical protein